MTNYQYLLKGRSIICKIIRQRFYLLNTKKSKLDSNFSLAAIRDIQYALSQVNTGRDMKIYLFNKKATLTILISSVNSKLRNELNLLAESNINNQNSNNEKSFLCYK